MGGDRLYRFVLAAAFFVVRARVNMPYRRRYSQRVAQGTPTMAVAPQAARSAAGVPNIGTGP